MAQIPIPGIAENEKLKAALEVRKALQEALNLDFSGISGLSLVSLTAPFASGLISKFLGKKIGA